MRLLVFLLFCACLFAPLALSRAQACLATPEAAARSIIGPDVPQGSAPTGFRVKDVQTDALMQRAWIRVARCENPGAPLLLVPLEAAVTRAESAARPKPAGDLQPSRSDATRELAGKSTMILRAGDPVLVIFASSAVQLEMEGTADQAASVGDTLGVSLKRRNDEPVHRMRGILRADHRVEVLP